MNYSEMLFNRDEKIIKIIEEKDKEIDKLTAESTEWESKYYDMLDNFHNANEEIDKQKEVLDKIREILNKTNNLTLDETGYKEYLKSNFIKDKDIFKTICHLEDFELIYGEILELLEEIE